MITREKIMEELKNRGYEVQSADVTKNGVNYQGITIGTETVRPTIYVDDLLNRELDAAVKHIINVYEETQKNPVHFNVKDLMNWDNIKTKLQLCIQKRGKEDICKRRFLDLEQYVRVAIDDLGTFKIKPLHLEILGIDEEILFDTAWKCTKPTLSSINMVDLMKEMLGESIEGIEIPQIVITNLNKSYGAIAMCDTDLLFEIADEYGTDLIILPSSIHECIVTPVESGIDTKDLEAMVREINETEVAPEEQLSDKIYRFKRSTRQVI